MPTIKEFQEEVENDEKLLKKIGEKETIIKMLQDKYVASAVLGEVFFMTPENQGQVLDFTTKMGACSNIYYSFVFQMPKWNYRVAKVSESMVVSPTHMETYNILAGQKQKLEGQIKQGLASAMQAVTDYELLRHDERRYREIIDYFKKGVKDDHVLRNLFVDRVDAYTGEGYSMITMAKRWPTIINDFIRMGRIIVEDKKEGIEKPLSSTNDIEKKLDVPLAEATVLHTKNELFEEWKELFRPVVQERYARIKATANSRKTSINQYKEWLKPYVARHKAMKEVDEKTLATNSIYAPAMGTSVAFSSVRLWVWIPFPLREKRKPENVRVVEENHGFTINPFDNWVKRHVAMINIKYGTKYDEKDIEKLIDDDFTAHGVGKGYKEDEVPGPWMVRDDVYYALFDVNLNRSIIKTPPPEGAELENFMLKPIRLWLLSQNALLLHLIELKAIDKKFNREIDEMIGSEESENTILNDVRKEMDDAEKEADGIKKKKIPITKKMDNFVKALNRKYYWLDKNSAPIRKLFFRVGPYENNFAERVTKLYMVDSGGTYGKMIDFWKSKFNVK